MHCTELYRHSTAVQPCRRWAACSLLLPVCTRRTPAHTSCQAAAAMPSATMQAPAQAYVKGRDEDDVCIAQFPAPLPGTFTPDRASFFEQHRLRGYEVRPDQRATIVTISNLMQEVAGNHAVGMWGRTDTGFANVPSMKDLIFVMTRMQIRMDEYPKWGDVVTVETYFTAEGRLAARREWVLTDAATGKQLGTATSTWVTINTATRRIGKLPDDVRNRFLRFSPSTDRQVIPVEQTKRKLPDFPAGGEGSGVVVGPQQVARRSDMDMNGHINNVTYLAWALEAVPQQVYDECSLYEVEIDFKAECLQGELVDTLCAEQQPDISLEGVHTQYLHTLRRGSEEIVRCRTSWQKASHGGNGASSS